jgi:uncharacterized membrane protein
MSQPESRWSDHAVEQVIGRLLQIGVLLAAAVVLFGAVLLLVNHGGSPASYSEFRGEPSELRTVTGIVRGAAAMHAAAIVQLGLVLLIATPIARVGFTLVAFVLQRDRTYVWITTLVMILLLFGLVFGRGAA